MHMSIFYAILYQSIVTQGNSIGVHTFNGLLAEFPIILYRIIMYIGAVGVHVVAEKNTCQVDYVSINVVCKCVFVKQWTLSAITSQNKNGGDSWGLCTGAYGEVSVTL